MTNKSTLSPQSVNHPAAVPDLIPDALFTEEKNGPSFDTLDKSGHAVSEPLSSAAAPEVTPPQSAGPLATEPQPDASPARTHQREVTRQSHSLHLFSGPLPDADELARYEAIAPGLAREMMAMLNRQNQADLDEQHRRCRAREYRHTLALICAFLLAVLAGLGGFDALVEGDTATGLTLSGGSLSALVLAFLKATQNNDQ